MRRRLMQGTIVIAVVMFAAVVGAGGAFAEGQGDPHAGEERGNPHVDDATGDPHVEASATEGSGETAVTAVTATVEAAASAAAAAPVAAAASAVTSSATTAATIAAKPADGSVGNADDKAPPGQSPNDKNKGYECDGNKGVGKGNPAHSGCPEEPTTPDPDDPDDPDDVLGVQFSRTNAAVAGGSLARTGGEQRSMATTALAFILTGIILVAVSRRRLAMT